MLLTAAPILASQYAMRERASWAAEILKESIGVSRGVMRGDMEVSIRELASKLSGGCEPEREASGALS